LIVAKNVFLDEQLRALNVWGCAARQQLDGEFVVDREAGAAGLRFLTGQA
jgi:hypothetical protein